MLIALPCNCHLTDANSCLILQRSKAARLQCPYKAMNRICRIYHKGEWTGLLLGRNAIAFAKFNPRKWYIVGGRERAIHSIP